MWCKVVLLRNKVNGKITERYFCWTVCCIFRPEFGCAKNWKSKKFAVNFSKKQVFLHLHQNAGRLENDYFDQRLVYAAPKRWSKYTTTVSLYEVVYFDVISRADNDSHGIHPSTDTSAYRHRDVRYGQPSLQRRAQDVQQHFINPGERWHVNFTMQGAKHYKVLAPALHWSLW